MLVSRAVLPCLLLLHPTSANLAPVSGTCTAQSCQSPHPFEGDVENMLQISSKKEANSIAGTVGLNTKTELEACQLPEFGQWCQVRPSVGSPYQMAVFAGKDIVSDSICESGKWEISEVQSYGAVGNALDVGGNMGYFTFMLANAGWNVQTFEPLPTNIALFNATMCANPQFGSRVTLHEHALGSHADTCMSYSDDSNQGDGIVRCGADQQKPIPAGYSKRGDFPVKRLDDMLADPSFPKDISFFKIDVEGFECEVLKGGGSFLKTVHPQFVKTEIWTGDSLIGCTRENYMDLYKQSGYEVYTSKSCSGGHGSPSDTDFYMCRQPGHQGMSVLQSKTEASSIAGTVGLNTKTELEACQLPEFGQWCQVRPSVGS
eukprot:CAMPEP_0197635048 /NCGR_PEP_ID=MMETSP1338-20131121/10975_1 /TAXON_ID=43686 ORGANISM="Pelagodinium beii, Strain RCC1491" /NCGR_SAMPLE_ID=MMETSP1338 /ASSEMBLY_ACC=CAM_ASM_000754 /LENGTH=373 /DNA_ID=CAMNT_0043207027 /DNA_START=16 /DNA_END=1133 /DNA_ORIENTATION=+